MDWRRLFGLGQEQVSKPTAVRGNPSAHARADKVPAEKTVRTRAQAWAALKCSFPMTYDALQAIADVCPHLVVSISEYYLGEAHQVLVYKLALPGFETEKDRDAKRLVGQSVAFPLQVEYDTGADHIICSGWRVEGLTDMTAAEAIKDAAKQDGYIVVASDRLGLDEKPRDKIVAGPAVSRNRPGPILRIVPTL